MSDAVPSGRRRGAAPWILLIAALVLLAVLADRGGSGAFDPRSVDPNGARGVVQVLEELGAEVTLDLSVPEAKDSSALLLVDRLTDGDRDLVSAWVDDGGVLVVADPFSPFAPDIVGRHQGDLVAGRCSIGALADARRLATTTANLFAPGDAACFGDADGAHIVAESNGAGVIVAVGGPEIFTNAALDEADEAVVLAGLLAPNPNAARVVFLGPSVVEIGEGDIDDLVAPRVSNAILQLIAAFLLYAWFRARRLGPVVSEPLPVRIEGSELVLGAGRLAERAKDPESTAAVLRDDLLARCRRTLGVPAIAETEELLEVIAAAGDVDIGRVRAALVDPVTNDDDLVRVAGEIDHLHDRLFDAEEAR